MGAHVGFSGGETWLWILLIMFVIKFDSLELKLCPRMNMPKIKVERRDIFEK